MRVGKNISEVCHNLCPRGVASLLTFQYGANVIILFSRLMVVVVSLSNNIHGISRCECARLSARVCSQHSRLVAEIREHHYRVYVRTPQCVCVAHTRHVADRDPSPGNITSNVGRHLPTLSDADAFCYPVYVGFFSCHLRPLPLLRDVPPVSSPPFI